MWTVAFLTAATDCLSVPTSAFAAENASSRPNIIFLMTDDQCTYSMGCYGTPSVQTPNLDQLASEAVVFDNYYVTTAICMGSRATVMTGLVEYRHGCNFEHGPLLREHWKRGYPLLLRSAGYLTAFAGKFGFEVADAPRSKGVLPENDFDRWGGGPGQTHYETRKNASIAQYADQYPHSTLAYGAFAVDFIRDAAAKKKPFCLSISFKAPHRPVQPDPQFDAVYDGSIFTKPSNYGRENGLHFAEQSRRGRQYQRFTTWHYSDDYQGVMAKYYQQIFAVDVAVGRIREALREYDIASNTVIIFTSDNGFMCGSHGYGSKVLPYEESARVPLIVMDPRQSLDKRGRRSDALCGSVDIAPTILALASAEVPEGLDGSDLSPLLDKPTASIHEALPLINTWGPAATHSLAVVTKDWKYIHWPYSEQGLAATEELYHTGADPLEMKELSEDADHTHNLTRMRSLYDRQVDSWRRLAVLYHRYEKFATFFQRSLPRKVARTGD